MDGLLACRGLCAGIMEVLWGSSTAYLGFLNCLSSASTPIDVERERERLCRCAQPPNPPCFNSGKQARFSESWEARKNQNREEQALF